MWTVIKVGGSLYDLPDLGTRLRAWLAPFAGTDVLLVPGGGAAAEAIRVLDRVHRLGAEVSHWLAIQAMSVNACFLHKLLPETGLISAPAAQARDSRWHVLDALAFFQADETRPDHLPHTWNVTSDSLAVRAATLVNADELILLKSVAWEGSDWLAAIQAGIVDSHFAEVLRHSPKLRVRVVNLRAG